MKSLYEKVKANCFRTHLKLLRRIYFPWRWSGLTNFCPKCTRERKQHSAITLDAICIMEHHQEKLEAEIQLERERVWDLASEVIQLRDDSAFDKCLIRLLGAGGELLLAKTEVLIEKLDKEWCNRKDAEEELEEIEQ